MTPRVIDNDRDEITVTLDGKEIRGWSYSDDAERRVKMIAAREFVEGWFVANARYVNSLPALVKALEAEEEADRLFDAADEYTHRADAEDWLNDPTGSLHVNEAWGRANAKRAEAKELRRAALASHKTGG